MFKDKTTILFAGLTLLIFFVAGLFDGLYNPIVIGALLTCFSLVIVNLILVKKEVDEDKPTKD
jgi:predicted Co/Zn/Cd cation transporter (cation efflux family)